MKYIIPLTSSATTLTPSFPQLASPTGSTNHMSDTRNLASIRPFFLPLTNFSRMSETSRFCSLTRTRGSDGGWSSGWMTRPLPVCSSSRFVCVCFFFFQLNGAQHLYVQRPSCTNMNLWQPRRHICTQFLRNTLIFDDERQKQSKNEQS